MRYAVLSADCGEPSLRDDSGRDAQDVWRALSQSLRDDIAEWHEAYQVVIPMDMVQRTEKAALIQELDRRGLELADSTTGELHPAKVRYYSEGRLRYLT
jgi:hypothetical protein